MSTLFPRIPLELPRITIEDGRAERKPLESLEREIAALKKYADDFYDAWMLFEFSHENSQQSTADNREIFLRWKLLSARSGAMTIHLFAKAFEAAASSFSKCRNNLRNVDETKLRSAKTMLESLVPEFESVSEVIVRTGEFANDLDPTERRFAFVSDSAAQDVLRGRRYLNTFDGKLQSYQVNRQTYEGLIAVAKEFYSVFGYFDRGVVATQDFFWRVRPD
jgi:hypothetical protein